MLDNKQFTTIIRKLAKSDKYQTLYQYFKEGTACLFENSSNFTIVQINFLHYLSFYTSLFYDLAYGEIDRRVLENEIYEDAYAIYKNRTMRNKSDSPTSLAKFPSNRPQSKGNKSKESSEVRWDFIRPPKK